MKRIFALLLVAILLKTDPLSAGMLEPKDNIAICGDSITEQKMYSVFMEDYFLMCQPVPDLQAHQFGSGGETAGGFSGRMKNAVLPFHPTVATTCYGMNDGGYVTIDPNRQKQYKESTEAIIKTFKDAGVRLMVVGSPGVVDGDTFEKRASKKCSAVDYNQTLADLSRIAGEVAKEQGLPFADIFTPMKNVMQKTKAKFGPDYVIAHDGIHQIGRAHV